MVGKGGKWWKHVVDAEAKWLGVEAKWWMPESEWWVAEATHWQWRQLVGGEGKWWAAEVTGGHHW